MNSHCEQMLSLDTNIEVKESSFDWVLRNYSDYRNCSETLVSSVPFSFDIDKEVEWVLKLDTSKEKNNIIVWLNKGSTKSKGISMIFTLLNLNGKDDVTYSEIKIKKDPQANSGVEIYNITRLPGRSDCSSTLPNDTLIVRFKVCYRKVRTSDTVYSVYKNKNKISEFDGFEKLLDDEKFHDARIIAENSTFKVHKCILSARSEYFSAMFESEMKENSESKIEITDVSSEVMQEVLRFIYAVKVNNIETLKMDLFVAADKYLIDGLKILCKEALIQDLKIENIFETLILADQYELSDLKIAALNLFKIHKKQIVSSDQFKSTVKTLTASVLINLIEL